MKKVFLMILIMLLVTGGGGLVIKKYILPPPETVQIILAQPEKSLAMAPHYLALNQGFFEEHLARVSIKKYGEAAHKVLAQKQADIVVMELADFLYHRYLNQDLVAFLPVTAAEPSYIMAREQMADFEWTDMKGKSIIGDLPESNAGILLEAALRHQGLAPHRDVTVFYNIPPDLKAGAFKAQSSTFIQASEPVVSQLEATKTARLAASLASVKMPALVYVTNRQDIKKNPEKLQRFTSAIYKASLWMKDHHQELAAQLAPEFQDMDKSLLASASKRYHNQKIWPSSPLLDRNELERFSRMMLDSGELPQPVDCSAAIENKFAVQALKTVKYEPPKK